MSGFSAEWLALREPADVAARAPGVTAAIVEALQHRDALQVADLGCGTGSNVRYLAARLPQRQAWRLLDHDAALLAAARAMVPIDVETHVADLRALDSLPLDDCDLVTASALLDLVSETWVWQLVARCRAAGAAVLVVLNYDGRIECTPADPDDRFVRDLVNAHQRGDKGFGPALGPDAGSRTAHALTEAGYRVVVEKSDWVMGPDQAELQRQLLAGWADAAVELQPLEAARIRTWEARRLTLVNTGVSSIRVGHDDVAGVLDARVAR